MPDFNKSHEVEGGVSFNDVLGLSAGAGDPWDVYTNAPVGSVYFRSDGTRFVLPSGIWSTEANWVEQPAVSVGAGLEFAIFLCSGALVYNTSGEPLIKVSP